MSMPVIAACAAYVMRGDRRVNKGAFHGTEELTIRNKMACTDTVMDDVTVGRNAGSLPQTTSSSSTSLHVGKHASV
jgi:hypothetical protein